MSKKTGELLIETGRPRKVSGLCLKPRPEGGLRESHGKEKGMVRGQKEWPVQRPSEGKKVKLLRKGIKASVVGEGD